jgi:hypothetical protein
MPSNWTKVSLCKSVQWHPSAYEFFLPGHKADKFFEGNQILILHNNHAWDPFHFFVQYLRSCDSLFPLSPALWLKHDGSIPTRSFFITYLCRFCDKSFAGQSMQAGSATTLAEEGIPPYIIQGVGQWASDAFQIYIWKSPILLQALICSKQVNNNPLPFS